MIQDYGERELTDRISAMYVAAELAASERKPWRWTDVEKSAFGALMDEYSRRHPLPANCWYGMRSVDGISMRDGGKWEPWPCGKVYDLPLPRWYHTVTKVTDFLGWRVIDLYERGGIRNLMRALGCWVSGGHHFSEYVQPPAAFNNPFGNDRYSHCYNCPACIRRV